MTGCSVFRQTVQNIVILLVSIRGLLVIWDSCAIFSGRYLFFKKSRNITIFVIF